MDIVVDELDVHFEAVSFQENMVLLELTNRGKISIYDSTSNTNKYHTDYTYPPRLTREEILNNIEIIKNILRCRTIMELYNEVSNVEYFDIVELINDGLYDEWKYGEMLFADLNTIWNCKEGINCFYYESRGNYQNEYAELLCLVYKYPDDITAEEYANAQFKHFDNYVWGSTWGYRLEWEEDIYASFNGMDIESSGLFKEAHNEIDNHYELKSKLGTDVYYIQKRIMVLMIVYRLDIKIPKLDICSFNIIYNKHKKGIDVRQYFNITEIHNKYTKQEAEEIVRLWVLEGV